jgi:hypothetical protein
LHNQGAWHERALCLTACSQREEDDRRQAAEAQRVEAEREAQERAVRHEREEAEARLLEEEQEAARQAEQARIAAEQEQAEVTRQIALIQEREGTRSPSLQRLP